MRIPEIQNRLRQIANEQAKLAAETLLLTDMLSRRPPIKPKAPRTRVKMTPFVRDQIVVLARANPTKPQRWIAAHLGIDAGRVSETLRGERT